MELFERLASVGREWNVLTHPFYTRWERGELEPAELGFYAGQYRHAVCALADAATAAREGADGALQHELAEHAAEERMHVELWDDFTRAVGGEIDSPARPETAECVSSWTAGRDTLESLAVLHAIESAQPEISGTKLRGLVEHYGLEEGPATAYFALHAERDHAHAAHSRAVLEQRATDEDTERLVDAAERALRGNWRLLDGVEAAAR
ncbi:MAG: iron-containing redox enzyme family protein [Actinobacteria bacterium]|nr:iron-containing redox enzyme family protein [Actinomycetota bacterium]